MATQDPHERLLSDLTFAAPLPGKVFPELAGVEESAKVGTAFHHNARGVAFAARERYAEALQEFALALGIDPRFAHAWNNRGHVRSAQGHYAEAIADFDQAIAIDPTFAGAWNNRGLADIALRQYAQAVADFDVALRLDPRWRWHT